MELTLLGTGCPSVDHKRFGPSNLVSTKTAKILVDCGSGITQRLHELKVSSADIDALRDQLDNIESQLSDHATANTSEF